MTNTDHLPHLAPDTLFVIACPVCRGHMAATRSLCGLEACCPLCSNLFRVPGPAVTAVAPTAALAEDWGGVIEQLAPPVPKTEPPPSEVQYPRMSYVFGASKPSGPSDETVGHADAELPIEQPTAPPTSEPPPPVTSDVPVVESIATSDPAPVVEPAAAIEATPVQEELTPDAAELVAAITLGDAPAVVAPPEDIPHMGPASVEPTAAELELREPVRTIRQGDTVIEIRRLTPEERRARRFRRNLMMIVIGVSILLAIVVIFGVPQKLSR